MCIVMCIVLWRQRMALAPTQHVSILSTRPDVHGSWKAQAVKSPASVLNSLSAITP